MPRAYSNDLRERVAAAVMAGLTCRAAAGLFQVSASSAVKWSQRLRETGSAAARPAGRAQRRCLATEKEWLLARLSASPDLSLRAVLLELKARGVQASYGSLWRLLNDESGRGSRRSSRRIPAARNGRASTRPRDRDHRGRMSKVQS